MVSSSYLHRFLDDFATAMTSVPIEKKRCALCQKTGGILTCDGCQQIFCGKHAIEHRQQLAVQLENIMEEHDCIQHGINLNIENYGSFEQIDKWEKEAIRKIQEIADKVRADWLNICDSSGGPREHILISVRVQKRSGWERAEKEQ